MLTDNMLLSVFFLTGALAACPEDSHLFITAPQKMEALSGSCLLIPCNFIAGLEEEFDGSRTTFGVWIKSNPKFGAHPDNVIFNSSRMINIYPMKITGNLSQKNCTTLFSSLKTIYTNTYYFRIESSPFRATAPCDPLQITVKDSPPRPRIEISGELKEKESVTITCSAFTPCPHSPPKLTWNLQQDAHNKIEENANRTFTTKIQKTITLSDKHDGYNITCSSNYSVNEGQNAKSAEEKVTLSVSYAPKDTSARISPSGLVSPGIWVNLTCSSRAKPAVNFTWFKISKDGPMKVSEGDFYSFNVTDLLGVYYCVATNDLGNQTSSRIHLTIKGKQSYSQWGPVVGGIIGMIVLIGVVIVIWQFKLTRPASKQTQSLTGEESPFQEPIRTTEEDISYGEIDFSKRRPEPSSDSAQDSGQQQDTVYAQVKVSRPTNLTQTADLYAEVRKK